jgi:hypothetical protein
MEAYAPALFFTFLSPCRPAFSQPTWRFFQCYLWALLLAPGRHCVTGLYRVCFFLDRSLTSVERFLSEYQWDLMGAVSGVLSQLQRGLGDKLRIHGAYALVLDTALVAKTDGKMPGVQAWHDSSGNPDRGERLVGHHWALGALLSRWGDRFLAWPLVARLLSGQLNPCTWLVDPQGQIRAATIWDVTLAVVFQMAVLLGGLPVDGGPALRVIADAFFSKSPFLNALLEKGFHLISQLRHDAVGWDDPPGYTGADPPQACGTKWKLRDLLTACVPDEVRVCLYGKWSLVRCVVRDVWLRDVNRKVRVVVVEGIKRPVLLLSTDLSLSAAAIIDLYAARFTIEIAIRDLKQTFGLGDYQATTGIAILRFVHLCCLSFCVWRWLLLPDQAPHWLPATEAAAKDVTPLSFTRARRGLRRLVLERLLGHKSASEADFSEPAWIDEAILRLAA